MIPNVARGLDFSLGETADMLRDTVQSFAAAQVAPRVALDQLRAARSRYDA